MERRKSMFVFARKTSKSVFEVFHAEPVPAKATKKIVYETSHPLGPTLLFSRDKAEKVMKETIDEMLKGEVYDEDSMVVIAKGIANEIREKLKKLYRKSRYKFVVTVLIVEEKQQDLVMSRKQLHSSESDSSAEMIYRSPTFVAYAYTVAFYQE